MRKLCRYDLDRVDLAQPVEALHTDIPRLRDGGVTGQFWSVYVPATLQGGEAVAATLEQIDFVREMVRRYPRHLAFATSAAEIVAARERGLIASLVGMEGGHSIDESLDVLRMMFDLGARYLTLTHNDNVPWADSATDEPVLFGLSDFGREVVREMNRLGMLVDLSHVSADVMRQALDTSSAPVIFSHSSARAICDVPRNVPDDVLARLAVNGGVCMVTFVADFVSPAVAAWSAETREMVLARGGDPRRPAEVAEVARERRLSNPPPRATIDQVVAHIEHVREVAGIDHIGIGGDFDGAMFMPDGLDDVSGYPRLFAALRRRHWSEPDIEALASGNALRVLRDAEAVAAA